MVTDAVARVTERHLVPFILFAQAVVTIGLAGILWLSQGGLSAQSMLLGGMAAVVPNAFLGARLLSSRAGTTATALMRSAWVGEIGKLFLTILLFAAIFALVRPISAPAVFGGFIAAQLVVVGALLVGGGSTDNEATTKS